MTFILYADSDNTGDKGLKMIRDMPIDCIRRSCNASKEPRIFLPLIFSDIFTRCDECITKKLKPKQSSANSRPTRPTLATRLKADVSCARRTTKPEMRTRSVSSPVQGSPCDNSPAPDLFTAIWSARLWTFTCGF